MSHHGNYIWIWDLTKIILFCFLNKNFFIPSTLFPNGSTGFLSSLVFSNNSEICHRLTRDLCHGKCPHSQSPSVLNTSPLPLPTFRCKELTVGLNAWVFFNPHSLRAESTYNMCIFFMEAGLAGVDLFHLFVGWQDRKFACLFTSSTPNFFTTPKELIFYPWKPSSMQDHNYS